MSDYTTDELAREYEKTFGEWPIATPQPAIKSWYGGDYGMVDTSRPASGIVWSKYGAATAAIRNAAIDSCVTARVSAIGALKWKVIDNASGETVGASDDYDGKEAVSTLLHRFARRNDGKSLFGEIEQHLSITGESYVELVRGVDRFTVTDIEFLNSLSMDPITVNGTDISYFQYSGTDGYLPLKPQDIIYDRYTKNLFTDIHGYSPIMTLIGAHNVGVMDAAGRAILSYWNNDGLPRAVISPKPTEETWLEEQQRQIRNTMSQNKGAGNKYKMAIFPFPFDSTVFNDPDLQKWAQLLDSLKPDVFLAFGVPQSIAGYSDSTRVQVSPQDRENWNAWIIKEGHRLQGVWNTRFVPAVYGHTRPPVTFRFDLSAYEPKEARADVIAGMNNGLLTWNEARAKIGEPPIAGGDVLVFPAPPTFISIAQFGSQPAAVPASPVVEAPVSGDTPMLGSGEPAPDASAAVDADKATGTSFTVALDLANHPDLIALQQQAKAKVGDLPVEWNAPDSFHVTLAHVPAADADLQAAMLAAVQAIPLPELRLSVGSLNAFRGVDAWALHFRIPRNVALNDYQAEVHEALEALGAPLSSYSEPAAWKPHITVGYASEKPPTVTFRAGFTVKPDGLIIWNGDDTAYRSADASTIVSSEPLTVEPPASSVKAQEDAESELEAWRRLAKRHGTRKAADFVTHHLDTDLASHIRRGMKADDMAVFTRVAAVVYDQIPDRMPDDAARLLTVYREGLEALGAAIDAAAVKAVALGVLGMKAIQTTGADFEANVETLLFEAVEGAISNAQFQARMRSLLQTTIYRAYVDGMRDGGVDDLPTEEDDAWVNAHIAEQYQYVRGIAEAIFKDGRVTEEEAAGRPSMWLNKSVMPAYYAGMESAAKDALLEWVIDPAKENCDSCWALNGQKRRASFWRRNVLPQSDRLACKGFLCGCSLRSVTGTASKGRLPRWQYAKAVGVGGARVYAHGGHEHGHEHDAAVVDDTPTGTP